MSGKESGPRYTVTEDQLIKKLAGKVNTTVIAAEVSALGLRQITAVSIRNRASTLKVSLRLPSEQRYNVKVSDADVELCRQLSEAGLSVKEIAEKMECSRPSVCNWLAFRTRVA